MPAWAEDKESALEARLRKKQESASEDRNVAKEDPGTPVRERAQRQLVMSEGRGCM